MDTDYAYLHSLQGDVTGLVDMNGAAVVKYGYDVLGNFLGTLTVIAIAVVIVAVAAGGVAGPPLVAAGLVCWVVQAFLLAALRQYQAQFQWVQQ